MQSYDLIIFDCDGVLIDSEVISAQMLIAELAAYGVDISREFVSRRFLGRSYPTVLKEIRESFGVALPERFETDYRARLLDAFARELKVMPGIPELLAGLQKPHCLATSSSPERVGMSLKLTGLDRFFAASSIFTSSRVARGKPAPDLFLLAAHEMGYEPARCLVIEDTETGIRAAKAAGMAVWRFTGGSHLQGIDLTPSTDAIPDWHFDNFSALVPALSAQAET